MSKKKPAVKTATPTPTPATEEIKAEVTVVEDQETEASENEAENIKSIDAEDPENKKTATGALAPEAPEVEEPQFVKRAKDIFAMYPNLEQCYFTSDGTAFTQSQHAMIHGETLKNSAINKILKSEVN